MNLEKYLKERQQLIHDALAGCLPPVDTYPAVIHEAMCYSLFSGGKRLRPILVIAAGEAVESPVEPLLPAACAVELIHTYSLVHDDLPIIDNDDFRRGKPTCHKMFGEDVALLAGDALLTQAFAVLTRVPENVRPEKVVRAINELALAAGSQGLIGGQVVDIKSQGQPVTIDIINYIHANKTGSLIRGMCQVLSGIFPLLPIEDNKLFQFHANLKLMLI